MRKQQQTDLIRPLLLSAVLLVLSLWVFMGTEAGVANTLQQTDTPTPPAEEIEMTATAVAGGAATEEPEGTVESSEAEDTMGSDTPTPPAEETVTVTPAEETAVTATPAATEAGEAAEDESDGSVKPSEAEDAMTPTPTITATPLSDDALISMGEELYANYCAACHQLDGEGIANAYPPLADNPFVLAEDPAGVLRVVFTGRAGMPHFRDYLTTQEIAAAVSYVRNAWENNASVVTEEEAQTVREEIYSPSEPMDHQGNSEKDGSSGSGESAQEGENGED